MSLLDPPAPYEPHKDGQFHPPPWSGLSAQVSPPLTDAQATAVMLTHMTCSGVGGGLGVVYWTDAALESSRFAEIADGVSSAPFRGWLVAGPSLLLVLKVPTAAWREQWLSASPLTKLRLTSAEFLFDPLDLPIYPIWMNSSNMKRDGGVHPPRPINWPARSTVPPSGIAIYMTKTGYHVMLMEEARTKGRPKSQEGLTLTHNNLGVKDDSILRNSLVKALGGDVNRGLLDAVIKLARLHLDQVMPLRMARQWPFYIPNSRPHVQIRSRIPLQLPRTGDYWKPMPLGLKEARWVRGQLDGRSTEALSNDEWFSLARQLGEHLSRKVTAYALLVMVGEYEDLVNAGDAPSSGLATSDLEIEYPGLKTKMGQLKEVAKRATVTKAIKRDLAKILVAPKHRQRFNGVSYGPTAATVARLIKTRHNFDLKAQQLSDAIKNDAVLKEIRAAFPAQRGNAPKH
ncbi:hypothetical protein LTR56_001251 [Elasticomyces elasticus]|nr:hypothetical protein LTR56_001251 [Elasticomyces elasticus]KAK3667433.1 hypothetical protein LTR22_001611 [Elasticomyces elasticus]KAK4915211.1 hypothetical protein LTR49_016607 [Elasticomyces elasticus]KAK5760498.1 hypothetical protein LTS12_009371 [Elasticomyces elasticus]